MNCLKRISTQWLLLVIWMAIIFVVSHQPKEAIPAYGRWDLFVKKGGHLVAYGVFAFLARRTGLRDASVLVLALAYATSDELHQRFVPGRTGTVVDVFIDLLGSMLSLLLLRRLPLRWREALLGQTGKIDEP